MLIQKALAFFLYLTTIKSKEMNHYSLVLIERHNKDGTLNLAKISGMAYNYSYTKDLKLKSKATCGRTLLCYEYNKNGSIIGIEDISGKATRYSYDEASRLREIIDRDKLAASINKR